MPQQNMPRSKEYLKLSEDQFKRLIRTLPDLRRESAAMQVRLQDTAPERLRELIGECPWWAGYYEMSFGEALGWLVFILGKGEWIREVTQSPDPEEAVLAEIDSSSEWGPGEGFTESDLFGAMLALQRNIVSIFLYGQSICGLLEDARQNEGDGPLFKAIRVDRSVVTCETAAVRISRAEALGEKQFFVRLKSAMKGPSQRHMLGMDLKYSLFVLRELGFRRLSDDQLEHLLVDVLKVYPKHHNARKNLRKQFYESRKIKTL